MTEELAKTRIILDSREEFLKKQLTEMNAQFTVEQLLVGDVHFKKNDHVLLICERKTPSDLYSSVVSGRFREQRDRLKKSNAKICYIIEGYKLSGSGFKGKNEENVISGALQNLVLFHNIPILPTLSVNHTAKSLLDIAKKFDDKKNNVSVIDNKDIDDKVDGKAVCEKNDLAINFVRRKTVITDRIHEHQLMLIPGVSSSGAKAINDIYPSARSLFAAYDKLENETEKFNLLAEVKVGKKKLGKIVSKRIYEIYHPDIDNE